MMQAKSLSATARRLGLAAASWALVVLASGTAHAQLAGWEVAQPFFDFPTWARWDGCRPQPLCWGFDPFAYYQPCDLGKCGDCNNGKNSCPDPTAPWVAHRPNNWYVTADFAPLKYDPGHATDVAHFGSLGPLSPTVLSTSALQNNFDAGGKFTIGKTLNPNFRLEGSYLGNYFWSDSAAVADNTANTAGGTGNLATLLSDFSIPATAGLDQNYLVSISNQTSMRGAEVNVRYWVDIAPGPFDFSITVGGRYMKLDDQFNFLSQSNNPGNVVTNNASVQTHNDMLGVQLGFETAWMVHPRYWIEGDFKAALCNNHATQSTAYDVTTNGALASFPTGITQNRTALIGDISVIGSWQMTPSLVFRAGYQALFVQGAALGPENLQTNNFLLQNGPPQLNNSGNVVIHGPIIGITWAR
jgi:hypothetical protein